MCGKWGWLVRTTLTSYFEETEGKLKGGGIQLYTNIQAYIN